jgi:hypothetical protein
MTSRLLRELRGRLRLWFGWKPRLGHAHTQSYGQRASTEVTSGPSVDSPSRLPFEVQSYVDSEIAQMREDGERPPESAEPVGAIYLGGNDYRIYFLSTNKIGLVGGSSGWTLWQAGYGHDDELLHCRLAFGYPYSDSCGAAFVAEILLTRALQDDHYFDGSPPPVAEEPAGLLSRQDIERIVANVLRGRAIDYLP